MKNDRAHKAFELFVPGLDKEVDMASDLVKAMFAGLIAMTIPDKPNSRLQKYRLTGRGNALIKKGEQGPL